MSPPRLRLPSRTPRREEAPRVLFIDPAARCVACARGAEVLELTGNASTLRDAVAITDALHPNAFVLARPPLDAGEVETLHALRARAPGAHAVVLSPHRSPGTLVDSVVAGAGAYLPLDVSLESLLDAIGAVAAGGVAFDPWSARVLLERFGRGHLEDASGLLTEEERAGLSALASSEAAGSPAARRAARACARIRETAFASA